MHPTIVLLIAAVCIVLILRTISRWSKEFYEDAAKLKTDIDNGIDQEAAQEMFAALKKKSFHRNMHSELRYLEGLIERIPPKVRAPIKNLDQFRLRAWDPRNRVMIYNAAEITRDQKLLSTTLDLQNPFAYFDGLVWMLMLPYPDQDGKALYVGDTVSIGGIDFVLRFGAGEKAAIGFYIENKENRNRMQYVREDLCAVMQLTGNIYEHQTSK